LAGAGEVDTVLAHLQIAIDAVVGNVDEHTGANDDAQLPPLPGGF